MPEEGVQKPITVRDQLYQAIWQAEFHQRYYYLVANDMTWNNRWLQMGITLAALMPAILLSVGVPKEAALPTFSLLTLVMAWSALSNYAPHAVMAMRCSEEYMDLSDKLRRLWLLGGSDEAKLDELTELRAFGRNIARGHTLLGTNGRLYEKAEDEARQAIADEFKLGCPIPDQD